MEIASYTFKTVNKWFDWFPYLVTILGKEVALPFHLQFDLIENILENLLGSFKVIIFYGDELFEDFR